MSCESVRSSYSRDRVGALLEGGFTVEQIAAVARLPAEAVAELSRIPAVSWRTNLAILAAYRRLKPDFDAVAIERILGGDTPSRLSIGDRREAVRRLKLERLTHSQIADRIHASVRTVDRIVSSLKPQATSGDKAA